MPILSRTADGHIEIHRVLITTAANIGVHVSGAVTLNKAGKFLGVSMAIDTQDSDLDDIGAISVRTGTGGFLGAYGAEINTFRCAVMQLNATSRTVGIQVMFWIGK